MQKWGVCFYIKINYKQLKIKDFLLVGWTSDFGGG
jgi:hypothetical protein